MLFLLFHEPEPLRLTELPITSQGFLPAHLQIYYTGPVHDTHPFIPFSPLGPCGIEIISICLSICYSVMLFVCPSIHSFSQCIRGSHQCIGREK